MTWIGACVVAAFLVGALLGSVFSRQREDSKRDQSHADKLDYPSETNQETSISTLARAHLALAKDANSADKRQSSYNERIYRVSLWTAIGVGTYTVFTAVIVVFSVIQYGETHRFNRKQIHALSDQLDIMANEKRPWIRARVSLADPIIFTDWNNNRGIDLQLNFTLKNCGESPAVNIRIMPRVMVHPGNIKNEINLAQNK
jgi:hypothetical protein